MAPTPCRRALTLVVLMLPAAALAQRTWVENLPAEDVPGSTDHPALSRYAGSLIIGHERRDFDELILPLGPWTQRVGSPLPEVAPVERFEGAVTRLLYVAPAGRSSGEVHRYYWSALLEKARAVMLFGCAGAECGKNFNLYIYPYTRSLKDRGDLSSYALRFVQDQRFLAARLRRPQGDLHVALYTAGARFPAVPALRERAVTLLQVVESAAMEGGLVTLDASALKSGLDQAGHAAVRAILFETDRAEVRPESGPALDELATLLRQNPGVSIYVVGHTDTTGSLDHNLDLSRRRAEAVLAALQARGIPAARMAARGVGPLAPVASNRDESGRAKNRRVELVERP